MLSESNNPKREQILGTAKDLFMRYGTRRVSIEEICRTANISKMTFYKFFANKLALTKELLHQIFDEAEVQYNRIIRADVPFERKVKQLIELKLAQNENMSAELIAELVQNPNPEIATMIEERRNQNIKRILKDLQHAQENGDIRPDIKPQFIVYLFDAMTKMMMDSQLNQFYATPRDLIAELVNFFFYGILSAK